MTDHSCIPELKVRYVQQIVPDMMRDFGYSTVMQVPKLLKIVLSMGLGEALANRKLLDASVADLGVISGQHAVKTRARKSIANFKLREGNEIGVMVTLRRSRMYEFLHRLINVALPRVKDFRGVSPRGFDGHGNYSMGITEQIIFPEIDFDKIERISGLNVNVVTSAQTDQDRKSVV